MTNLTTSNLTATGVTLTWVASASSDCTGYDVYRGTTLLGSVTGTNYNVTGLTQATQYTFIVKAKDAVNNIASGTQTTVTTPSSADTTPPANVTNLTTANITQTGLTLNWTTSVSSDVASYDVYNGSTFLANVTGVTYNVNGLTASTAYTFVVKAKDGSGNAASGTSVNATTLAIPADTTAPSNVTNLTTSALTQTGVTLTWTAATDNVAVTGYDIYNGASLVTTVTGITYSVTGLTAATQYTFTVKAKDAAGNVASGTSTTVTTSSAADTTPPNPVTGLTAGTPTANSVSTSWTLSSSGDVSVQEAAYSTDGTNFTVASAVINASSTSYNFTGLTASTAYTFRIVAIDGAGNRSTAVTVQATTAGVTGKVNDSSLILYQDNPTLNQTIANPDNYFHNADQFTAFATVQPISASNSAVNIFSRLSPNAIHFQLSFDSKFSGTLTGKNGNGTGSANFPQATTSPTAYTDHSVPYHVVFMRDSTSIKMYVNNVLLQSTNVAADFYIDTSTSPLLFAGVSQVGVTFKNMGYYNRALTTAELTQNYNALK